MTRFYLFSRLRQNDKSLILENDITFIMITGVQEENGSGQEGLLEGLGSIQSESCVEGN